MQTQVLAKIKDIAQTPLTRQLKRATKSTHDSLDKRIMRAAPFSNPQRYQQFLRMQYRFHWLVSPLFRDKALNQLIEQLSQGCRLEQVVSDCGDLQLDAALLKADVDAVKPLDICSYQALGWLYTIEGSNIGAAFLFKFAKKLNFDENHGAAHLAGHPLGRAKHWKHFKRQINALPLTEAQRELACEGARDAFQFVRDQVEELLPESR